MRGADDTSASHSHPEFMTDNPTPACTASCDPSGDQAGEEWLLMLSPSNVI